MERYSHLQTLPNSPLTPLTPLSENTHFEFNFGGDGSLDMYIDKVRKEHRIEQQKKKLLERANRAFQKEDHSLLPKRYSQEFVKIRDKFEAHGRQLASYNLTPKVPVVKITHDRRPLKLRDHNVPQNSNLNPFYFQQQQKLHHKQQHHFRQASPVAPKPLCPKVASILEQNGLSVYCELFQREEIDLYALHLLELEDLHGMGITNLEHLIILGDIIHNPKLYFFKFKES